MKLARAAAVLARSAVCLATPRAHADPLFRIHVRPSLVRRLTPRLPSVSARKLAGLVPQAALVRAAVTEGKGTAIDLLRHR
jgi:hypothetical protein